MTAAYLGGAGPRSPERSPALRALEADAYGYPAPEGAAFDDDAPADY